MEIFVKGEACDVAAAKLEVADALVAACCFPDQPPVAVQMKEPPTPPPPVPIAPYPAPGYVDWSQAATPWAPWTVPAPSPYPVPAMPSGMAATPYMDFSGFGMTPPDMMLTGFQPGSNSGYGMTSPDMMLTGFQPGGNSCYGMTTPDMMLTGFQPGSSAGASRACAHVRPACRSLVLRGRRRSRHAGGALHAADPAQPCRAGHRR